MTFKGAPPYKAFLVDDEFISGSLFPPLCWNSLLFGLPFPDLLAGTSACALFQSLCLKLVRYEGLEELYFYICISQTCTTFLGPP